MNTRQQDVDAAIEKVRQSIEKAQKRAKKLVKGISPNSCPNTTRNSILDTLALVSDNDTLLAILMQAEIWAEGLNKTKYYSKPTDIWVKEFDWLRHVLQQRDDYQFKDAVEALKSLHNDRFDRAWDYAEDAGLISEFKPIYDYYNPRK